MNHCQISIMANELVFLKHKLPFLYKYFDQLIFVDYDIINKKNSCDGSIEFIENFKDPQNKITLVKNFNPDKIKNFNGVSMIEKRKMFAKASEYVKDDIDIIWATDLDEFFFSSLIKKVEGIYKKRPDVISIDMPHTGFVYNECNYFKALGEFYMAPRITRHVKGKIYGHCNFNTYGKTIKLPSDPLYHFAYVGYNRCAFKFKIYKMKGLKLVDENTWFSKYLKALKNNKKHIKLPVPRTDFKVFSEPYIGTYPPEINFKKLCQELNKI